MKRLVIRWQRLVSVGETCPRCSSTEASVDAAASVLGRSLAGLGIEVAVEKLELTPEAFLEDALQSNRIWIGGAPIEELLGGGTGQSLCCGPCGDTECRTIEVGGRRYETITERLIIRAGLVAASRLLAEDEDGSKGGCCG